MPEAAAAALKSPLVLLSLPPLPSTLSFILLTRSQRQQFIPRRRWGASKLADTAELHDLTARERDIQKKTGNLREYNVNNTCYGDSNVSSFLNCQCRDAVFLPTYMSCSMCIRPERIPLILCPTLSSFPNSSSSSFSCHPFHSTLVSGAEKGDGRHDGDK